MAQTISSQHYLSNEIVESKRAAKDYTVLVSPAFEVGGEVVRVVIDGHHSLAAARLDGVEPEFEEATVQTSDRISLLAAGKLEDFLEASWIDGDWYNVDTDAPVWG